MIKTLQKLSSLSKISFNNLLKNNLISTGISEKYVDKILNHQCLECGKRYSIIYDQTTSFSYFVIMCECGWKVKITSENIIATTHIFDHKLLASKIFDQIISDNLKRIKK